MADGAAVEGGAGAWEVLLAGRQHIKTSDVQEVCDRFRELRGGGAALSDSWLSLQELTIVLGVSGGDEKPVQPLFQLLTSADDKDAAVSTRRCDLRVLLVAMAGLTRAKVPDRMRFAALLLDEAETGFLTHEQVALIMRANTLLGAVASADSPALMARAQTLVEAAAPVAGGTTQMQITHDELLDIVRQRPAELCISDPPWKRAKTSSRATTARSLVATTPATTARELPTALADLPVPDGSPQATEATATQAASQTS